MGPFTVSFMVCGLKQWRAAAAGGADLLWRIKSNAVLPVRAELPDGSYLSDIAAAGERKRADAAVVRVIEYTLDDPGRPQHTAPYRLITTILDHEAAPAAELAARYNERWEIETTLDELKTHQRGPAQDIGTDPDRLSFTRTLRLARRRAAAQAAISP